MRSAKVRPDFTVELPEELRATLRPGESLDVVVTGERVTYARRRRRARPSLREVIERVRRNPPAMSPSNEEIEEIIHQVRQGHDTGGFRRLVLPPTFNQFTAFWHGNVARAKTAREGAERSS